MAMGRRGRAEAEYAISSCRPFRNSTGSFHGSRGSTRTLGWLSSHTDARRIQELLSRAVYVVWSYDTPIAFVSEDEDGDRTAYYVDEDHSPTTSNHQSIARMGMGEYETIGTEGRRERERAARRSAARQRALGVNQQCAVFVQDDSALVAAVGPDQSLVGSPGYQNGLTEDQQASTLARLLDSRLSDPNWVPGRDRDADYAAELRDARRVEDERVLGWRL